MIQKFITKNKNCFINNYIQLYNSTYIIGNIPYLKDINNKTIYSYLKE